MDTLSGEIDSVIWKSTPKALKTYHSVICKSTPKALKTYHSVIWTTALKNTEFQISVIWKPTTKALKTYPFDNQNHLSCLVCRGQVPDAFKKRISTPRLRKPCNT